MGENRCYSYVYFQPLKGHFLAKIMFFDKNLHSTHFNFTEWPPKWKIMISPLVWYQICNCNHHKFEEILNFQFSEMSTYSWICPEALFQSWEREKKKKLLYIKWNSKIVFFYKAPFLMCCITHIFWYWWCTHWMLLFFCFFFHQAICTERQRPDMLCCFS